MAVSVVVIPVEFVSFLPFYAAEVAAFVAILTAVQVAFCHYYTTGILVWSRSWSDIW
jgi:hypothetical protein